MTCARPDGNPLFRVRCGSSSLRNPGPGRLDDEELHCSQGDDKKKTRMVLGTIRPEPPTNKKREQPEDERRDDENVHELDRLRPCVYRWGVAAHRRSSSHSSNGERQAEPAGGGDHMEDYQDIKKHNFRDSDETGRRVDNTAPASELLAFRYTETKS